uniref:Sulfhydryl oxidase n=1 Tax=Ditylum brightwellii TaxID=49249 RepID=A0A7S4W4J2_9STRA
MDDNNKNNTLKPPPPSLPNFKVDDCDRPACDDTVSALTAAFSRIQKSSQSTTTTTSSSQNYKKKEGPINKDVLGKSTWNLLHSMSAWYPEKPSKEDEMYMTSFIEALGRFYPCTYCAHDFRGELHKSPPRTKSRKELCIWLCEQHNIVNQKLYKPQFPCDLNSLDQRWRNKKEG